jgi:hypothetical protein
LAYPRFSASTNVEGWTTRSEGYDLLPAHHHLSHHRSPPSSFRSAMREYLRKTIYNRSWVLDLAVVITLFVTIFFLVGQQNQTDKIENIAKQNRSLNQETHDLAERVRDCTDPIGTCYKQGTQRTNDAVGKIGEISAIAAACADKAGEQTLAQIELCVRSVLLKGK